MEHNEESSLEPFASNGGGIAPGKFWVEAPSVGHYVSSIGESWRRGVTAMLDVARLCADASERLTSEQRQDLVDRLPFGQTAFSKFVTIGKDKRLDAPEVIQCLSPHYSIAYLLTGLREEELKAAIAANVVHPDMRRSDLEKWLKANRAPRSKEEPADQATVSPLSEAAQSGTPALVQTPEPVQVELPDLHVDGESHTLVPRNDTDGADIGTDLDEKFERLKTLWEEYVKDCWDATPDAICDRFVASVLDYPERIAEEAGEAHRSMDS